MRYRASQITILLILLCSCHGDSFCQSKWNFTFKAYSSATWFDINKRASVYNHEGWKNIDLSFKPKYGWGLGIGTEYAIRPQLKIVAEIRYNKWGGYVYAVGKNSSVYSDLSLNIDYKSLNIPISIKYIYHAKYNYNLFASVGVGLDYTYRLRFVPANFRGKGYTFKHPVDIETYYLLAATGAELKLGKKLVGTLGLEVNNDWLLNPKRNQDFTGYYRQEIIPLTYTMLLFYIGIKI